MTKSPIGRMLLSHNFDVSEDVLPKLNREEFTQVFTLGLQEYVQLQCRQLSHPHWMVEILFPTQNFSPSQVGEICAQALFNKREHQIKKKNSFPDILILGGLKKTPPLSDSPDTLQPGEWGVDVVETQSAEQFLTALGWQEKTAGKTIQDVFKVAKINGNATLD